MRFGLCSVDNVSADHRQMDDWIRKVTTGDLNSFQLSCIRRFVVEFHVLALRDFAAKGRSVIGCLHSKLPVAERQIRHKE